MRFLGANSREAMRQVRAALGDEALILANRHTEQGVEILAMAESAAPTSSEVTSYKQPEPQVPPAREVPVSTDQAQVQAFEAMSARLLEEMRDMRALLARDRSGPEAGGTAGEQFVRAILEAGFSQALAEEVVASLPEELADVEALDERAMAWLVRQLSKRLVGLDDEAAFMDRAGIVALVGPTGVGKTTTTAKLTARYVMRHGTRPVALVTTDSFRIGAHEQLRIYSRLLDVPMYALNADQPVSDLLERMKGKSCVLIDTVGMSQRDQRVIEQIGHLRGGNTSVRLVLLLNSASQPETLEEVVVRYRQAAQAAGGEISDCIITKLDEAGRLAPVLDIIMRHGLRLLFVSHGQRVPEDMALAEPVSLIEQCLANRVPLARATTSPTPPDNSSRGAGNLLGQGRRLATVLLALRERLPAFDGLEAVWNLLGLPASVQQQRFDALLADHPRAGQAHGMLWSERRRVPGEHWAMPDVALNAEGTWLALPLLQHRQVAGQQARLESALQHHDAGVHLMNGLPDAEAGDWLERQGLSWCSQVRGSLRVAHAGERHSLAALESMAEAAGQVRCRFRGAPARLMLAALPVEVNFKGSRRERSGFDAQAWFGEVRDAESGKALARRYWIVPAGLSRDPEPLLLALLQADVLPQLARRAWQRLEPTEAGDLRGDVRLLMASGLATVAAHLDFAEDEAAMDLRAELLGLGGGRRRRRDVALLESLLQLFLVRDAIRHLGLGERETG
ncbi:flagellar biosynthesis protein FlhF [Halomonas sp. MCCC 1A11081]|uniref:Flagellar biosynthesis protein FlhF n=2 Tax=Billgrantia ethanolica TaxID=2733486 RepID=A0ABS9A0H8_9GAMM|nr:flagellar biosynthesis protein FlhF [Halomonas ethanolica]MCE8002328.1 flagellar biosynthesis protein FlhF [Halomonas ethanolica]